MGSEMCIRDRCTYMERVYNKGPKSREAAWTVHGSISRFSLRPDIQSMHLISELLASAQRVTGKRTFTRNARQRSCRFKLSFVLSGRVHVIAPGSSFIRKTSCMYSPGSGNATANLCTLHLVKGHEFRDASHCALCIAMRLF